MNSPTQLTYDGLDDAYAFFNDELFEGTLPGCLITMQRRKGAYGYFSGERFAGLLDDGESTGVVTDEIALNPANFKGRTTRQTLSTLVHEMVHLWQHHFGSPGRGRYHNAEWATKMREIGLIPTDTGMPGGKQTGQRVTHMIDDGGPYARAYAKLEARGATFLYHDRYGESDQVRKKKLASKTKYTCPACETNAWGKPDIHLVCGDCDVRMVAEASGTETATAARSMQGDGVS